MHALVKLLSQGVEAKLSAGLRDEQAVTPQSSALPSNFASSPLSVAAGSPGIESSGGLGPGKASYVDFPYVGTVGQRLSYVIRLSGWLSREGMVEIGTFADWALEQLEGVGTTLHATAVLFALLTAFLPVSL